MRHYPSDATLEELFDEYAEEVQHRPNTKKSIESAKRHFSELPLAVS